MCVAPLTCDLRTAICIIGFALKGPPKWGFGMILGVEAKIFGGTVHPSLELRVLRYLWSRSESPAVAFFMDIAICHRRKFGQLWGSPAPLPEVAGTPVPEGTPLYLRLSHGKIGVIL